MKKHALLISALLVTALVAGLVVTDVEAGTRSKRPTQAFPGAPGSGPSSGGEPSAAPYSEVLNSGTVIFSMPYNLMRALVFIW